MVNRFRKKLQKFGPGIIFASTAIGVSHLVQSTRAGAEYGFTLIIFILMANIFKYPFLSLEQDMLMQLRRVSLKAIQE